MKKIVGVKSAGPEPFTEEDVLKLRDEAFANIDKITEKPTLESLYKAVDEIWEKGLTKQLIFQNKDQHYAYVTTYFHDQLEHLTLDQYKSLLKQQTMSQITALLGAMDRKKQEEAYKLHKEHEAKMLKNMEDQINDLKDRNTKVSSEIKKEMGHA